MPCGQDVNILIEVYITFFRIRALHFMRYVKMLSILKKRPFATKIFLSIKCRLFSAELNRVKKDKTSTQGFKNKA